MTVERVLIMAAGTGGHVFPALAIARQLEARGVDVSWLGTPNGMENKLLADSGFTLHRIAAKGLKGKGIVRLLSAPWMLLHSLWQSLVIMRRVRPDCVLGMGGYVSGPGGLAAKLSGRRLYLHEQNAVAGLTNRVLAKLADEVFEAFPNTFPVSTKVKHVGNPVRSDIEAVGIRKPELADDSRSLRVLVLGGSQGAKALNDTLPHALAILAKQSSGLSPEVRHQTGAAQLTDTLHAYEREQLQLDDRIQVSAFIENMAEAYSWADLVICRAGASTVSEIAAAGKASILVPYPYHKDQQQLHNARWLEGHGAAIIIKQSSLNGELLAQQMAKLNDERAQLLAMATAAHHCALRGVDATLAEIIMEDRNAS